MRTINTCAAALASLLITGFSVTAPAAEKSNEVAALDSVLLEEIVVTARRREESVQTVPVAVTAITADDLINRSALVLSDVAKETPGLSIQSRVGDPNTQVAQLRGQVQTDSVATLDPSVGLYLNDIYVARNNGANFELFDVDRVEILAGPQGTLYGRNTTGGAIKLITTPADLKGKYDGYTLVSAGNFNHRRVEGAVNIPISDKFAVRVAALDDMRDGYSKVKVGTLGPSSTDVFGPGLDGSAPFTVNKVVDADDKNTTAGRVSATFEPTDKLRFSLVGDYSRQNTNGTIGYDKGKTFISQPPDFRPVQVLPNVPIFVPLKPYGNAVKCSNDFYTSCANFAPSADAKTFGEALTASYDTSIGTAKLIYGHRSVNSFYRTDTEGTEINFENVDAPTKIHENTYEAQLQGQNTFVDYTVGVYYFKESGDEALNDFNFVGQGTRTFITNVDNDSKSIYAQTGFSLTKTLRLTTGARYTHDDKGIESMVFLQPSATFPTGLCLFTESGFTPNPSSSNCHFQRDDGFGHLSWTVGLDWQPRDGILAYIKTSEGYRSGGENVRGVSAATEKPFDEETIHDVELGLKSRLADRVRLNLTFYHSNYSNIQTTQFLILPPPQNTTTIVINQGTAQINGLEAQSMIVASDNLSFDLTGSYTDVNYSASDVTAQLAPKYKGALGTNLFFPTSFGDVSARLSYSYQGAYNDTSSKLVASSIPELVTSGRGLVDARLAMNIKAYDLGVALYGTNLTNKEYPEVVLPLLAPNVLPDGSPVVPGGGPTVDVLNRIQVGAPRMFGLELRKRF